MLTPASAPAAPAAPALAPASPGTAARLPAVDALRGGAIAAMVIYHLCWDLDFLGFVRLALTEAPAWLAARTAIVSAFLALVGVGLVLATAGRGLDRRRFLRRLGLLVAAAGAVSAVSYAAFPDSTIFFGVLHHIALASVVGLAFVRLPPSLLALLGAAVVAAPGLVGTPPGFDGPWLLWVGLMSEPPVSNDFVPLFPWFGVVLLGMALGRLWRPRSTAARWRPGRGGRALAWAGRHSLAIYLVHQPVLFGALWLAAAAVPGVAPWSDARQTGDFLENCRASCLTTGGTATSCQAACGCVVTDLKAAGLWQDMLNGRLQGERQSRFDTVVLACLTATPG